MRIHSSTYDEKVCLYTSLQCRLRHCSDSLSPESTLFVEYYTGVPVALLLSSLSCVSTSLSKVACLSTTIHSSPPSIAASRHVASLPRATPATPSGAVPPLGLQPTGLTPTRSRAWAAGAVTVFDNMLTCQQLSMLRPRLVPSTPTPTSLSISPSLPGTISDPPVLPSLLGSPLTSLQPPLATISPCGMLLASHVAMAGSPQATHLS